MDRSFADCEGECSRLSTAFAYYVDHRQYDALLELFTPDGILDRRGEIIDGRDAIRSVLSARAPDVRTRHVCTNIFLTKQTADSAEGVTYFTLYRGTEHNTDDPIDLTGASFVGEYQDVFKKTPSGWKFQRRAVRLIFQREAV